MQKTQTAISILSADRACSHASPLSEAPALHPMPPDRGAMPVQELSSLARQPQIHLCTLVKQLGQLAASSLEPAQVMSQVAVLVAQAFQSDGCLVMFTTSSHEEGQTACWLATLDEPLLSPTFRLSPEQSHFWSDRTPTVIANVQDAANRADSGDWLSELTHNWQEFAPHYRGVLRSFLGVSAESSGAIKVRINLLRSQPYSWPTVQVEQLEIAAQQVVSLLSQAYQQQQLQKKATYQSAVRHLATAIRHSSNLNELFQTAISEVGTVLNADQGLLLRLKYWDPLFRNRATEQLPQAKVTLTCKWQKELHTGAAPGAVHPISDETHYTFWMFDCALCQQAFLSSPNPTLVMGNSPLLTDDSTCTTDVFQCGEQDTLLITPLENQDTILGFLAFSRHYPSSWQPEEVELVELVSAQLSTAIIQTETLRQVQSLVDKRTAELKQSLAVQAKLYERTRAQLDQLRHLNQLKDEFLDTVSHELRTPLTSMSLAIRMLRQTGMDGVRAATYLDILEQQCAQETNLVNDLLTLRELDSKQTTLQLAEVNLNHLIQEVIASFQSQWTAKGLTLNLEVPSSAIVLWSDRESLTRILVELLTNATRYAEPHTCLQLIATERMEDVSSTRHVILTLSNQGTAIPPEELPYIFDRFRRCHSAVQNAIPGTGLGLALVRSLTQHLNGTISASSVPLDQSTLWQTEFILTLPQTINHPM